MIQIIMRIILTPFTVIADLFGCYSMVILGYGLAQERGEQLLKDGTKMLLPFYTKELWRRPWFKNK